jgi:broad specificity phosphatase PhoE
MVVTPTDIESIVDAATAWGRCGAELILVRHGRPLEFERRRPGPDQGDPPLDALGRNQVRRAARLLAAQPVGAVYTSDLVRAVQTAEIVAQHTGRAAQQLVELREIAITGAPDDGGQAFIHTGLWRTLTPDGAGFRRRINDALTSLATRHIGAVVVIAHSGVINAHLADILCLDRDYAVRPGHASVTRTQRVDGRWYVVSINETAHLPPHLRTA